MNNTRKPHKWYRIEMTATGQVYAREVPAPARGDEKVGRLSYNILSYRNVGRYTCSCCVGYL